MLIFSFLRDSVIMFMYVFQGSKVLQNDDFTKDLFRFLQLLCEGHNNGKTLTHLFMYSI